MKKIATIILTILLISLTSVVLVACNKDSDLYYVSMRINPEIEMIVNGSGKVEYVNAVNDDGAVVLEGLDLNGKSVADAGVIFTDKAIELGYIDVETDGSTVYVGVEGENETAIKKFQKNLTEKINVFFSKNGVYGKVSQETLDKYATQAQNWGVNFGQAKMVLRVLDMYPEMSAEEVLKLSVQERMKLIKNNKNLIPSIRAEYREKLNDLKVEYNQMFDLKTEIEELKLRLSQDTITEEERNEINAQIESKTQTYNTLHAEYENVKEQLKIEYQQKTEEAKAIIKNQHKERQNKFAKNYENHKNECKRNKKIKENVKKWQNS